MSHAIIGLATHDAQRAAISSPRARKEYTPFSTPKKALFLALLTQGHTATHAAREKGIYHQGVQVGTETVTEYSDTLLIFLLKAKRPEVYRDRTEVKHTGQVNHAHVHADYSALSLDELRTLERLSAKIVGPAGDPASPG
jgi:hypothetical protein